MDEKRFDTLVQRLERVKVSRGGLIRGLAGGALALGGVRVLTSDADAAKRRRRRRVSTKLVVLVDPNDPCNGGFVGKGDVQAVTVCNWNNAELQKNAKNVRFSTETIDEYEAVCEWWTGPEWKRKSHAIEHKKTTGISSTVAFGTRENPQKQVTGFNLTGCNDPIITGTVPEVGEPCLGEGTEGKWISVELVSSSGGGLEVTCTAGATPVPLG
jgi:hypothetical protein